ncbi:hypothetical protein BKA66DRAFT_555042 [Pyrenochaeta sp. MPI-SDFR-AT-0127]|nr:hypothetical protein BKA66DRAFT_555042 [Pyrenochaeta sp. MPI-SDFR-AT-0127]
MPPSPTSPPEDVRPTDGSASISTELVPAEPLAPSRTITLVSLASRPIKSKTERSPSLSRETCAAAVYDRAEITGRQYKATIEGPEALEGFAEEAFEPNPVETVDVAVKLAEQLMRFHGCDTHAQNEQDYNSGAGHITLNSFISHHDVIPNTLSAPHMLAKGQVHPSNTKKWKHAFLGLQLKIIIGFTRTLAVAKQGIRFNVTPYIISNLDSDIHLTLLTPTSNGRTRRVPLHMDTLRRWTDRVLLPAIYSQASASILQHYPAGYEHSKLSSKAGHTEAHTRKDKSGVRHQYIHHFLQHNILQEV